MAHRVLAVAALVYTVSGHGALTHPRSRNQIASDAGRFYDVHALRTANAFLTGLEPYAGLPWPEYNPGYHIGEARPASPCGTQPDNSNINGGKDFDFNSEGNFWGDVETVFQEGDQVSLTWEVSQNHNGYYSYRVCDYASDMRDGMDDCFSQPMLAEVGTGREWIEINHPTNGAFHNFTHTFQLPVGLSCERCVLVWRWDCQLTTEVWHNCADISITGLGGPTPGPPPSTPPTSPPTDQLPASCYAIAPQISDAYCESNCNFSPPFCPADLCRCD